jgi:hypothetical protein
MRFREASMTFLVLVIVASTLFVAAANAARPNPGVQMPVNTGFAGQGQFRQGMQTGVPAQGQAGGFGGGAINVPAGTGLGQQGAGIAAGERSGSTSPTGPFNPTGPIGGGQGGQGGPGTCYCIRAPCNCGGTSSFPSGSQLPPMSQHVPSQPVLTQQQFRQPLKTQTFPGQSIQPLTAPAGGIQSRQF